MNCKILTPIVALLVTATAGLGQNMPAPSIVVIDIDNGVFYGRDVADFSLLATTTAPSPAAAARNFAFAEGIGDIVAVNGKPMRGTWHARSNQVVMNPAPQPGQAIADVTASGTLAWIMDIRTPEGQPVGVITGYGWNGGGPPLGVPRVDATVNMVITGGTGAFVGIRGQMGINTERAAGALPYRGNASITEDPGYRLVNGPGQTRRHVLQIFPMFYPEVLINADGSSAAWHNDASPVTTDRPARAGELVTLAVSNLGAVQPNIEFGQLFPVEPLAVVNSPVEVLIDGKEALVINQVGWPGFSNRFRVDFQVPVGVEPGMAALQVRTAFINGPVARIPVR
jgi:hypothetical protein